MKHALDCCVFNTLRYFMVSSATCLHHFSLHGPSSLRICSNVYHVIKFSYILYIIYLFARLFIPSSFLLSLNRSFIHSFIYLFYLYIANALYKPRISFTLRRNNHDNYELNRNKVLLECTHLISKVNQHYSKTSCCTGVEFGL